MSDQHIRLKKEEEVFPPLSNESIREAVRLWRHDQAQATEKYTSGTPAKSLRHE